MNKYLNKFADQLAARPEVVEVARAAKAEQALARA
jgi:hypothetical protein